MASRLVRQLGRRCGWSPVQACPALTAAPFQTYACRPPSSHAFGVARSFSSSSSSRDPYKVLGVPPTATTDEIKAAYRKLALQWHPDRNQNKRAEAEAKFKEVAHAYSQVSDPDKREAFRRESAGWQGGWPGNTGSTTRPPHQARQMWRRPDGAAFSQQEAEEIFRQAFGNKSIHEIIKELEKFAAAHESQLAEAEDALQLRAAKLKEEVKSLYLQRHQAHSGSERRRLDRLLSEKHREAEQVEQAANWAYVQRAERQFAMRRTMSRLRGLDPVVRVQNMLRRSIAFGAGVGCWVMGYGMIYSVMVYFFTSFTVRLGFALIDPFLRPR